MNWDHGETLAHDIFGDTRPSPLATDLIVQNATRTSTVHVRSAQENWMGNPG